MMGMVVGMGNDLNRRGVARESNLAAWMCRTLIWINKGGGNSSLVEC